MPNTSVVDTLRQHRRKKYICPHIHLTTRVRQRIRNCVNTAVGTSNIARGAYDVRAIVHTHIRACAHSQKLLRKAFIYQSGDIYRYVWMCCMYVITDARIYVYIQICTYVCMYVCMNCQACMYDERVCAFCVFVDTSMQQHASFWIMTRTESMLCRQLRCCIPGFVQLR